MSYLKYWTDLDVESPQAPSGESFPIRCHFDNDSDELINHRDRTGHMNLEVFRELCRSLKGMGFNAIDIHDQLGRAEFYEWQPYIDRYHYEGDLTHIEAVIDIAHEEGLMVQIPMYLCWAFDAVPGDQECWHEHAEVWKAAWERYMAGPLGKGDIFLFRPRSPIWDSSYRCKCSTCKDLGTGKVMTQAFAALEAVVLKAKPEAKLVCELYGEGYYFWKEGSLEVSTHWILSVANSGYGTLICDESAGKGDHQWGIYIHAGFWLDHTVQDPHLEGLQRGLMMAQEKGLNTYMLVNGQTFKNFILNLEYCAQACQNPQGLSPRVFRKDWATRLFGEEVAAETSNALGMIHQAHMIASRPAYLNPNDRDRGFVLFTILITKKLIERLNGEGDEDELYISLPQILEHADAWSQALDACEGIEAKLSGLAAEAFSDQLTTPTRLAHAQADLGVKLHRAWTTGADADRTMAKEALQAMNEIAEKGSRMKRFETWYHIDNARLHTPMPGRDAIR